MSRKRVRRPCGICGKWFRVNPRQGDRQRVCSSPECQRERHRRNCKDWHGRNPGYDADLRLRQRLYLCPPPPSMPPVDPFGTSPLRKVNLEAARDAVGQQVVVLVEVASKVLWQEVRDAVRAEVIVGQVIARRLPPDPVRDAIASAPAPP